MPVHSHLVFRIDNARYGIPAASVTELVRAVAVMPLAGAPAVVQGLVDYRGEVLPVFDVARRFHHPPREVRAAHRMIVASAGSRRVILHVDDVESLVEVDPDQVRPMPTRVAADAPVAGVYQAADGLLVIQDLDRFLSQAESEQLDAAIAAG